MAARRTLSSDDFNRANSTSLGANWTGMLFAADPLQIVSNTALATVLNAAFDNLNLYSATVGPNDQWAQVQVSALSLAEYNAIGVGVRINPTSTVAAYNGYVALADVSGGIGRITLQGSSGTLGTASTTISATVGDLISIEAIGTTIAVYYNSTSTAVISVTNTARTSGSWVIEGYPTVNLANSVIDNFIAGDFFDSTGVLRVPQLMLVGVGV